MLVMLLLFAALLFVAAVYVVRIYNGLVACARTCARPGPTSTCC